MKLETIAKVEVCVFCSQTICFKGILCRSENFSVFLGSYENHIQKILILRILELVTREVCIFLKTQASFYYNLLFGYVFKQTFQITQVGISQKVIGVIMRKFRHIILCEDKDIGRFSYLNSFNFKLRSDFNLSQEDIEAISIEIISKISNNIILNTLYHPPRGNLKQYQTHFNFNLTSLSLKITLFFKKRNLNIAQVNKNIIKTFSRKYSLINLSPPKSLSKKFALFELQ